MKVDAFADLFCSFGERNCVRAHVADWLPCKVNLAPESVNVGLARVNLRSQFLISTLVRVPTCVWEMTGTLVFLGISCQPYAQDKSIIPGTIWIGPKPPHSANFRNARSKRLARQAQGRRQRPNGGEAVGVCSKLLRLLRLGTSIFTARGGRRLPGFGVVSCSFHSWKCCLPRMPLNRQTGKDEIAHCFPGW